LLYYVTCANSLLTRYTVHAPKPSANQSINPLCINASLSLIHAIYIAEYYTAVKTSKGFISETAN